MKLKRFLPIILVAVCACGSAKLSTQNQNIQTNQVNTNSDANQARNPGKPLNIRGEFPENLRDEWENFTASGQYRLAQASDMTFSEEAKKQAGSGTSFYAYAWGDLNYPKRVEDDHLAAIVVDKTKTDTNKFGLVIFSPIKDSKDKYEINWLYRDQDLSKSTVNRASGELYVAKYSDDGSRQSCSVKWNPKIKKFECGQ